MEEENKDSASANVKVVCRFRPLNSEELKIGDLIKLTFSEDNKNLTLNSTETGEPLKFNFDYIFQSHSAQPQVYAVTARPIVESAMQGFNGTVFAYGQTSSGKTFTMTGPDLDNTELMGIIPRMVSTVFDTILNSEAYIEYSVKVSYCEIYMEKIKDLLDVSKVNLKIHEDKTRGVYIDDVTEKYVASDNDVYEIMKTGLNNRNVGSTNMNSVSSRSHSIFLITIGQTNNKDLIAKTGKLYLVDLAGSERIDKTGAAGKRLEEAKTINKSLTMLGIVIYSLTDGKSTHIPYRDSKLTRILQDSLGGNSKTALIITCSPSLFNEQETISTLRFGMRAKSIKNSPKVNREYTVAELKLIWNKCKEEIVKKDKRISFLEDCLKKIGAKVENEENKDSDEEDSQQTVQQKDVHDDVIDEVERFRTLVSEEVQKGIEVKLKLVESEEELRSSQGKLESLLEENSLLKGKSEAFQPSFDEKVKNIKRLENYKEDLDLEIQNLSERVIDLEKKNRELETDFQDVLSREPRGKPSNNFKELIKNERETNVGYQKEIQNLRQNLNEILQKRLPGMKIPDSIKEEISKREREKWVNERKGIVVDLHNSLEKVDELEGMIAQAKDSYKNIEGFMSDGEMSLKKKTDTISRNLEQLTQMYHSLTSQKSKLGIEKKLTENKLNKLNDRNKFLELENKKLAENMEQLEQALQQLSDDRLKQNRMSMNCSNIKKTITGGGSGSNRNSVKISPISMDNLV